MYSLVLLMMCRVRGLIPAGSFSSAWIRGISSPVSRFLIITLARISWVTIIRTDKRTDRCLLRARLGKQSVKLEKGFWLKQSAKQPHKELLPHLSALFQSWSGDAEGRRFVLHSEMQPVHLRSPRTQRKWRQLGDGAAKDTRSESGWRFRMWVTCAVTTLSPLVALARSRECCSSLVRILTVLPGDSRPEDSRGSQLTAERAQTLSDHTMYRSANNWKTKRQLSMREGIFGDVFQLREILYWLFENDGSVLATFIEKGLVVPVTKYFVSDKWFYLYLSQFL